MICFIICFTRDHAWLMDISDSIRVTWDSIDKSRIPRPKAVTLKNQLYHHLQEHSTKSSGQTAAPSTSLYTRSLDGHSRCSQSERVIHGALDLTAIQRFRGLSADSPLFASACLHRPRRTVGFPYIGAQRSRSSGTLCEAESLNPTRCFDFSWRCCSDAER